VLGRIPLPASRPDPADAAFCPEDPCRRRRGACPSRVTDLADAGPLAAALRRSLRPSCSADTRTRRAEPRRQASSPGRVFEAAWAGIRDRSASVPLGMARILRTFSLTLSNQPDQRPVLVREVGLSARPKPSGRRRPGSISTNNSPPRHRKALQQRPLAARPTGRVGRPALSIVLYVGGDARRVVVPTRTAPGIRPHLPSAPTA